MKPELTPEEVLSLHAVYSAFGQAAHTAQLLEKELAATLYFPTLIDKAKPTAPDEMTRIKSLLDHDTLGGLIQRLKPIATFDPGDEARLDEANKKRIFLMHHFFAQRSHQLRTAAGRQAAVEELNGIQDFLRPIYLAFSETTLKALKIMGVTAEQIEAALRKNKPKA